MLPSKLCLQERPTGFVTVKMLVPIVQLLTFATTFQAASAKPQAAVKDLQHHAIAALKKVEVNDTQACTVKSAAVRKDW